MILTGRLLAAASLIPQGRTIADIGTDHGYLPVYACEQKRIPRAIAADIVSGPLQAAIAHVQGAGLADVIECRLGDGLTCIQPGEVDGAVICGMGGPLMVRILQQSPAVWKSMQFLILQPQSHSGVLRHFLYTQGWHIEEETLLVDDGRLYELMRAVPGKAELLPDWMYEVGPINWQRKNPLLRRKIQLLVEQKMRICQGLKKSCDDKSQQIRMLEDEITSWEDKTCQLQ